MRDAGSGEGEYGDAGMGSDGSDLQSVWSPLSALSGPPAFVCFVLKFLECHLLTLWPWAIHGPLSRSQFPHQSSGAGTGPP